MIFKARNLKSTNSYNLLKDYFSQNNFSIIIHSVQHCLILGYRFGVELFKTQEK